MINIKAVLTYKRKRFSSQSHIAVGIKEANSSPDSPREISSGRVRPKAEFDSYNEKLDVDNNLPQKILQHSASIRSHDSEEMQHQIQEKRRMRKSKSIEISEMGPMKLRSHKLLVSKKISEDGSKMGFSCNNSGLACKITCVEGNSRSKLTDLDIRRSSSTCLNSSTERCSSGCPDDSVLRTSNSDNMLLKKEHPKENCNTPLITFCRRVKKKPIICETSVERSLKAEENHCSSTNWSSPAFKASYEHEDSSQNCKLMDQSISAAILLGQGNCSSFHVLQQDMMADADKDFTPESAPVGGFLETKIASDMSGRSPFHTAEGPNSENAELVHEDLSDKCMKERMIDTIEDSVFLQGIKQSMSNKIGTVVGGDLRNQLIIAINSSDKMTLPHDVLEQKCPLNDLNLSVAPPSPSPSTAFPSNIELNKPSMDVEPENLPESQSSSTPSCAIVVDGEADGKSKELEWLESLDKALKEAKKDTSTCQFRDQGDSNCAQVSRGRDSCMIPVESLVPSNQDESREYMNHISSLQEREYLGGPLELVSEKQQHEDTSNRSLICTNFLGLSLPLNSDVSVGSVKGLQDIPSRSTLVFKEIDLVHHRRLPWLDVDENSSLSRHKQIVEDVVTGTRMLKERQGSLLDKYKRYSTEWSEEELDFLWIGVRRHGMYNWNAMLKDPKLHFLESRVAEDLSKQWDLEQKKLRNGTLLQPASLSRPFLSSSLVMDDASLAKPGTGTCYGGYGARSRVCSEFPIPANETKLSLGDLYFQKENSFRRNLFLPAGLGMANPFTNASPSTASFLASSPVGSTYLISGIRHQKQTRSPNTIYEGEPSILRQKSGESSSHEQQPAGHSAVSDLPHWLKGVLGTPPGPRESVLPPPVPTIAHSASLLNNDMRASVPFPNLAEPPAPTKDASGRGILKRKSQASGNSVGGLRMSEMPPSTNDPWMGARLGSLPSLGLAAQKAASGVTGPDQHNICDLNKRSSGPAGPSNLVVIESDASSEETISDNQGSRI